MTCTYAPVFIHFQRGGNREQALLYMGIPPSDEQGDGTLNEDVEARDRRPIDVREGESGAEQPGDAGTSNDTDECEDDTYSEIVSLNTWSDH